MECLSPAKVNLFLHVTGKRPNGYHDLEMLMCAVTMYDRVTFDFKTHEDSIQCSWSHIPSNDQNLAFKALKLYKKELGIDLAVSIQLEKHIPDGAGLGGGSSNAATVLNGMNQHFGYPLSGVELERLALKLGADVPFFIHGRPSWVTGLGEKLEFCEKIKPYKIIILYPGVGLSTAEVYKKLNFGLTKSQKKIKSPLLNKEPVDPLKHLFNDLEIPAMAMCPEIAGMKDVLKCHQADGILMSGSGSSVFGLYSDSDRAITAFERLKSYVSKNDDFKHTQVFLADLIV